MRRVAQATLRINFIRGCKIKNKVSAVILSGGISFRFGSDKTLAKLKNKPLIQWVCDGVSKYADEVCVVSKNPSKYAFLHGVQYLEDIYTQQCPLVGFITALGNITNDIAFIIAADMPLFPFSAISEMLNSIDEHDAAVPDINGKIYPCCGLYRKSLLDKFNQHYINRDYRLTSILNELNVKYLDKSFYSEYDSSELGFTNINTVSDINKLEQLS